MASSAIFSAFQGIRYSLVSTDLKRLEDSVRAGGNSYLTVLLQMIEGSKALDFVNKAKKAAELPPVAGKSFVYVTPIFLAVLKKTSFIPEKMRPTLTAVQDHVGTFYQVAAVVSSLSLLYFGQPFFAVPSLCILGIGFMDRNGWMPSINRQSWHQSYQPLFMVTDFVFTMADFMSMVTDFISEGMLTRALIVSYLFLQNQDLLLYAGNYFFPKKAASENFSLQGNLTYSQARDFLAGDLKVAINRKFIYYNPVPPIPDIDIQRIVEKFDQIKWEKHLPSLRKKLQKDDRFRERQGNPYEKADTQVIAFAKHSLQEFIRSVKDRDIRIGEPSDYAKMHNYLKLIMKHLEEQKNEVTWTDILFRLAIEGGEYCGPGKFQVAESVCAGIMGDNPEIPFRDKVLYCLQDERNFWMEKHCSQVYTGSSLGYLLGIITGWQDVHIYNRFVNLYGDEFGLRKAAADNDDTAVVSPAAKWFASYIHGRRMQRIFWQEHSVSAHVEIVIDAIGTSKLPTLEVYAFWQNWIDRQQVEESTKEALREELAVGQLFGRSLEISYPLNKRKFHAHFVTLMLLDMGIAEIVPVTPAPLSAAQPIRV